MQRNKTKPGKSTIVYFLNKSRKEWRTNAMRSVEQ